MGRMELDTSSSLLGWTRLRAAKGNRIKVLSLEIGASKQIPKSS